MYLTEAEARKKWCPFVRARDFWDGSACSGNADAFDEKTSDSADYSRNPLDSRCIASECMAWRWGDGVLDSADSGGGAPGTKGNDVGYCGIAGKP